MVAPKHLYTVYDRILEKDIYVNASAIDVSRITGISPSKVGLYADNKWVYDKRYLFTKTCIPNGASKPQMEDLVKRWDDARFRLNPKARAMT